VTEPTLSNEPLTLTVESRAHNWRLDHYLTRVFSNFSRALLQKAIEQERVLVNGLSAKASRKLRVNDLVSVRLPELPDQHIPAENIPLDILYEDEHLVAINKPPGMIVHPGKGQYTGTLCGALQFHFDKLSDAAGRFRPGIVHRLDRDTSGVLLVAKDNQVHHRLSAQFEQRVVQKEYRAIVWGEVDRDSDYIETFVRVHPGQREKMMVCPAGGNAREAVTFYKVLSRSKGFTSLALFPKTGRTHQLRVHLQHLKHPIVADRLYGGRTTLDRADVLEHGASRGNRPHVAPLPEVDEDDDQPMPTMSTTLIARQALHAFRIEFKHPATDAVMQLEAPMPADILAVLEALESP